MATRDLAGMKFGRLTALTLSTDKHPYRWRCRCECGNELDVLSVSLCRKKRSTKSCGCLQIDAVVGETHSRTHNMSNSRTYRSWSSMIMRCHNPRVDAYSNYGARGIQVCPQWRESFESFLSDMGQRPEGKTLDRIDSGGDYCKENCRWATKEEQGRNKRNNRYAFFKGQRMLAIEVAQSTGIPEHNFYRWLNKNSDVTERAQKYIERKSLMTRGTPSQTI